ncbi:MFS transporter [Microlunatus elymi]|uniref:MFS transporter n=1 Tax=Microlunatus elymi TaxID=2596828 RepID=UPI00143CC8AE|nr:MFS transporter [Microlunatus elymi]
MQSTRLEQTEKLTAPDRVVGVRRGAALIACALTFGLVQLDATIVQVSLDSLRTDLGGGIGAAQWVIDGYAVPFAACMLAAGALGDRFGHRRGCLVGFVIFGLASILAAVSGSWALLITARALQGVGAAVMLPASLAIISRLYSEPRSRSRALGVWGGVATTGFAAGPALGGLLITHFGWPSIFWINVPAAAVIATTIGILAPTDVTGLHRIHALSTVLGMIGLAGLTGTVIEAGQGELIMAAGLSAITVIAGCAFVRTERRTARGHRRSRPPEPLIPPGLLRPPAFRWALLTGLCFNLAMYGALLCVSLTLQSSYDFSVLQGGLAVLPMALVVSIGATGSGYLAARVGPRPPMIAGFTSAAIGSAVIAVGGWAASPTMIIAGLTVVGLCSLAMPAMTSVALNSAPIEHAGLAGGALNTTRQLGGAIGVALLGAILNVGGARFGFVEALLLAAIVCAVALLSTVRATTSTGAGHDR